MTTGWNYCEIIIKQVHGNEHGKPTNQTNKQMIRVRYLKINLGDGTGPKPWATLVYIKIVL